MFWQSLEFYQWEQSPVTPRAEQISQIASAISMYYTQIGLAEMNTVVNATSIYIKLGLIPTEMIKNDDSEYVYDAFNSKIYISSQRNINWDNGINVTGLRIISNYQNNDGSQEMCANIVNTLKAYNENLVFIEIVSADENGETIQRFALFTGDKATPGDETKLTDVTVSDIHNFCNSATDSENVDHFAVNAWWY